MGSRRSAAGVRGKLAFLCDNPAVHRNADASHRIIKEKNMRTIETFLALGIVALTVGCGGSSSSGDGGGGSSGNGGIAGGGGISGSGGVSGGGSSGSCNLPSCLGASQTCVPSGACVQQDDATTGASNICYANGVKIINTIDASLNITSTVKKGTTTCWSMTGTLASLLAGGALTLKNGSGAVVGTLASDPSTGQTSVTCTGSSAVLLSDACNASSSSTSSCTTGTCTP